MAGETRITVIGNLTADPEINFTQSGLAVANFTVASTARTFDSQANDWKDGEPLYLRCSCWRDLAKHVGDSLIKGTRVVVTGNLKQRTYEAKTGEKRTVFELEVDEIGPSLKYATAVVHREHQGDRATQARQQPLRPQAIAQDTWTGTDQYDETPF